jgi:hypothetical protein
LGQRDDGPRCQRGCNKSNEIPPPQGHGMREEA